MKKSLGRRKIVVYPQLQKQVANAAMRTSSALSFCVAILSIAGFMFLPDVEEPPPPEGWGFLIWCLRTNGAAIAFSLVLQIALLCALRVTWIHYSHKTFGPLLKLETELRSLANKGASETSRKIKFRTADVIPPLDDAFNQLVARRESDRSEAQQELLDLRSEISDGRIGDALERIDRMTGSKAKRP